MTGMSSAFGHRKTSRLYRVLQSCRSAHSAAIATQTFPSMVHLAGTKSSRCSANIVVIRKRIVLCISLTAASEFQRMAHTPKMPAKNNKIAPASF